MALALASIVFLAAAYFHRRHIAEQRLAEFKERDPDFAKRNWAFLATGQRNRLGLEVTRSVGLIEIKARGPGEPEPPLYGGSAVVKNIGNGAIWEVVEGKARLFWSPNPYWWVTTEPLAAGVALAALAVGMWLSQSKTKGKAVRAVVAAIAAIGVALVALALAALTAGQPPDIWGLPAGPGVLLSAGAVVVGRCMRSPSA